MRLLLLTLLLALLFISQINTIIDIGFSCGLSGDYSITAEGMESFGTSVQLILEDLSENITINLREVSSYDFSYSTGDDVNRFKLFVSSPQGISDISNMNVNIYSFDNIIKINNNEAINGEIIICNILGEKVSSKNISRNSEASIVLENAQGVYLVKFITDKGVITKKVYVK